jgi:hypothetical protein
MIFHTDTHPSDFSRRDALRSVLRGAALAMIGGVSWAIVGRKPGAGDCRRNLPCMQCGLLAECRLPRAADARQSEKGAADVRR